MSKKVSKRKLRQRNNTYRIIHDGPKKSVLACTVANNLELKRILSQN